MLIFLCPDCGKQLKIAETFAGKMIRCPACRHQFSAPLLPMPFDPVPQPAPEPPLPEPPPPPSVEEEPLTLPLAEEPAATTAVTANLPIPLQDDGLDGPIPEGSDPARSPDSSPAPRRKKKKKRKRKKMEGLLDTFRYYTDAFGVFPWVMLGLIGVWLLVAGMSFLVPALALFLTVLGGLLYLVGWFWFVVVAFRDDGYHGALCLVTHFYWIVYLFMNMEEAWRPTALMILGILVAVSGVGLLGMLSGPTG